MNTYSFSLGKAQKMLQKLREAQKEYAAGVGVTVTVGIQANLVDVEGFYLNTVAKLRDLKDRIGDSLGLDQDVRNLKSAIFAANVTSGVDQKLAQLELIKGEVAFHEQARAALKNLPADAVTVDGFTHDAVARTVGTLRMMMSNTDGITARTYSQANVQVALMDLNQVEAVSALGRKAINMLEDEIARLNASTVVEIDLREKSAKLLGLL